MSELRVGMLNAYSDTRGLVFKRKVSVALLIIVGAIALFLSQASSIAWLVWFCTVYILSAINNTMDVAKEANVALIYDIESMLRSMQEEHDAQVARLEEALAEVKQSLYELQ